LLPPPPPHVSSATGFTPALVPGASDFKRYATRRNSAPPPPLTRSGTRGPTSPASTYRRQQRRTIDDLSAPPLGFPNSLLASAPALRPKGSADARRLTHTKCRRSSRDSSKRAPNSHC